MAEKKNPGVENLIPMNKRSEAEQRAIKAAGGKASGEARRKKRKMRELAQMVLTLQPEVQLPIRERLKKMGMSDEEIATIDVDLLSLAAIATKAIKGDLQAYKMLHEMSGNILDARTNIENKRLELQREMWEAEEARKAEGNSSNGELERLIKGFENVRDGDNDTEQ